MKAPSTCIALTVSAVSSDARSLSHQNGWVVFISEQHGRPCVVQNTRALPTTRVISHHFFHKLMPFNHPNLCRASFRNGGTLLTASSVSFQSKKCREPVMSILYSLFGHLLIKPWQLQINRGECFTLVLLGPGLYHRSCNSLPLHKGNERGPSLPQPPKGQKT